MRYGLMIRRLDVLKRDYQTIQNRYESLNTQKTINIINEIKALKGKSFDGGCAWQPGDYMFENIYKSTPTVMMSTNGFQVNMTNTTGTVKNIVEFTTNSTGIKINSIVPKNKEFPVCWLVVPPANPENN